MTALHPIPDELHGDWNYTIVPVESVGRINKQPRKLRTKL